MTGTFTGCPRAASAHPAAPRSMMNARRFMTEQPILVRVRFAQTISSRWILLRVNLKADGRADTFQNLLNAAPELVRLRQTVCEATGIGAVAAPVGQFLPAHPLVASGGVLPGEAALGIERDDIRQRGTGVLLQTHAAAARHLRYLIDGEDHHLVVGADDSNRVARTGGDCPSFVRHLHVQHLLALAGVADAIVLVDDKALPFMARGQEPAPAPCEEQRARRAP